MKLLILLLGILSLSTSSFAQDSASFSFSFDHLALSVKDVDRSATFYKNVLKLKEIENRAALKGIRWFAIGDGRELHLISIVPGDIIINKAVHIALKTPSFDELVKALDQLHIVYSDWPGVTGKVNIRADGIKQIFFQDPDGYWIEVNSVE